MKGAPQKLLINLQNENLDKACVWSIEMHIHNLIHEWWQLIVSFVAKNIHISNPKIGKFLANIIHEYPELSNKNNAHSVHFRQAIILVTGVCVFSPKDIEVPLPRPLGLVEIERLISSVNESKINQLVLKLSTMHDCVFIQKVFSQISFHIYKKNWIHTLKLLNLCISLEKNKDTKHFLQCSKKHWTLFMWDVLLEIAKKLDKFDIVHPWFFLYSFGHASKNNRIPYIINSILLLTSSEQPSDKIIYCEDIIHEQLSQTDKLYSLMLANHRLDFC